MLAGDLERANFPAIFAPNQLVIRFPPGYNQQCANCAEATRQQRIQDAVRRITGEPWLVRVEQRSDVGPQGNGATASTNLVAAAAPPAANPLIEQLFAALDARLLKLDDGFGRPAAKPSDAEPAEPAWAENEEE